MRHTVIPRLSLTGTRLFFASVADQIEDDWADPAGIGLGVNAAVSADRGSPAVENEGKERAAVGR